MSLEELEEAGLLRPQSEWGQHDPETEVPRTPLIVQGALAAFSAVLMYWGDGGAWTWVGFGVFFLALAGFTWISLRGIGA